MEKATHKRFAALRAFREWFYLQDELLDHVNELQRAQVQAMLDSPDGDV
jgi:hypothetical protein